MGLISYGIFNFYSKLKIPTLTSQKTQCQDEETRFA
jgi:hypothetical protein